MRYRAVLLMAAGTWISQAQAQLFAPSAPAAVAHALANNHSSTLSNSNNISSLPFGMNYSRESRGVMLQLDDKNTWGLGVGNLDAREGMDGTPGHGFRLNNTPTPGAVLLHSF